MWGLNYDGFLGGVPSPAVYRFLDGRLARQKVHECPRCPEDGHMQMTPLRVGPGRQPCWTYPCEECGAPSGAACVAVDGHAVQGFVRRPAYQGDTRYEWCAGSQETPCRCCLWHPSRYRQNERRYWIQQDPTLDSPLIELYRDESGLLPDEGDGRMATSPCPTGGVR